MTHDREDFVGDLPDTELFDVSEWPVAFVRFPELHVENRGERVLSGLDRLLDQKIPFVVVWTPASHDHNDEPHQDEKRATIWMKRRRAALAANCAGYLYIVTDSKLRALFEDRFPVVRKLLPFPKRVVEDRDQARAVALDLLVGKTQ